MSIPVYLRGEPVGDLDPGENGARFCYSPAYYARPRAEGLSPALPVQPGAFSEEETGAYFRALVPEEPALTQLVSALGIAAAPWWLVLARAGGDLAGAVSVGEGGHALPAGRLRTELAAIAASRRARNGASGMLSGESLKVPVTVSADTVGWPCRRVPSTHVLRVATSPSEGLRLFSEALVMRMGAEVGLPVVGTQFYRDPYALLSRRSDRQETPGGRVKRLHQVDLCQVQGVARANKREAHGGPSFAACFRAIERFSCEPALDKMKLIQFAIFTTLVGAQDTHAGALSFVCDTWGFRLAAFHGLYSSRVGDEGSDLLGFRVGGAFNHEWLRADHWGRFAADAAVKPGLLFTTLRYLAHSLPEAARRVAGHLRDPRTRRDEIAIAKQLTDLIQQRCTRALDVVQLAEFQKTPWLKRSRPEIDRASEEHPSATTQQASGYTGPEEPIYE